MFLVSCSSNMFCSFLFISLRFSSPGFTRSRRTEPRPPRSPWEPPWPPTAAPDTSEEETTDQSTRSMKTLVSDRAPVGCSEQQNAHRFYQLSTIYFCYKKDDMTKHVFWVDSELHLLPQREVTQLILVEVEETMTFMINSQQQQLKLFSWKIFKKYSGMKPAGRLQCFALITWTAAPSSLICPATDSWLTENIFHFSKYHYWCLMLQQSIFYSESKTRQRSSSLSLVTTENSHKTKSKLSIFLHFLIFVDVIYDTAS